MARRTFNRRPVQIDSSNSNASASNYFNHFNWKGINQNRNFLAVDQETFSDANNVYIDDEGLLKSRLPVKFVSSFENKDVKDLKNFDEILVYVYDKDDERWIGIIDGEQRIDYNVFLELPLKAFKNGDYVYIFTNKGFLTYDSKKNQITESSIYNPITRIYTGSNFSSYEDENLISNYNRYQYLLFPTKPGEHIQDSINSNAYDRIANYTHYINEIKINHDVKLDRDNNFLNIIHQPLIYDISNFQEVNAYAQTVPTTFIYNNTLYRWYDDKLWSASTEDMIFSITRDLKDSLGDPGSFVKIKLSSAETILIIYTNRIFHLSFSGEDVDNTGIPPSIDYFIDADVIKSGSSLKWICMGVEQYRNVDSDTHTYGIILTFNRDDNTYSLNLAYEKPDINDDPYIEDAITDVSYISETSAVCAFALRYYSGSSTYELVDLWSGSDFSHGYLKGTSTYNDSIYLYNYQPDTNVRFPSNRIQYSALPDGPASIFSKALFVYNDFPNRRDVLHYGVYKGYDTESIQHTIYLNENDPRKYYYNGFLYEIDSNRVLNIHLNQIEKISDLPGTFVLNPFSKYWFYLLDNENCVISNYRTEIEELNVKFEKNTSINDLDVLVKGDKIYCSKSNNLYIGEIVIDPDDDLEKLYFKKSYEHDLDQDILGLHQISNLELAIFTKNGTWYNTYNEGVYHYKQSKIVPLLKNYSDLVTLPDSTTTLMPSENGIVALSYQNFVNTGEQSTVNLTQDILNIYDDFESNINNINWKQYTIFYESCKSTILIYDNRYSSWWNWSLPINVTRLFSVDNILYILSESKIYKFSDTVDEYFDKLDNENRKIDWFIQSQKMHLGANNNYKHIINMTFASVQEGDQPISMNLSIKNYRKYVDDGKIENFDYDIDVIRTFVKRLNYAKVCEFQYKISSDTEEGGNAINVPLSLSDIGIKYRIGGQIR